MLFTFEGVDGVGKSTILNYIKEALIEYKHNNFILTKEPQYISPEMKQFLVHYTDPLSKLNWFYNDHIRHMKERIYPNVENNIILCDRYIHSRIAYQSYELTKYYLDKEEYMDLHDTMNNLIHMHKDSYWPDKIFIIWMDKEMLKERLSAGHDGMDESFIEKLSKIENVYLNLLIENGIPYIGYNMNMGSEYIAMDIIDNILSSTE